MILWSRAFRSLLRMVNLLLRAIFDKRRDGSFGPTGLRGLADCIRPSSESCRNASLGMITVGLAGRSDMEANYGGRI